MLNTFSSSIENKFERPLGFSDDVLPCIDRICYRLPDHIRREGGLGLHIDRNPYHPYKTDRFRPIHSFISLTDHYDFQSGGLQLIDKFHNEYDEYFCK